MKFYYLNFSEYRKLDKEIKNRFLFLSTSYTVPSYWDGISYKKFVPEKHLFYDACSDFLSSNFEERYRFQINSLNRDSVLEELNVLSEGKDIVFLVWEPENKGSERDVFIPWLTNTSINDIKVFSFLENLNIFQTNNEDFFNL